MIDVTVVVATHGSLEWKLMGDAAIMSVPVGVKTLRIHEPDMTLAQVRNAALSLVETEYITYLDADDSLSPDYFKGVKPLADVIVTAIQYPDTLTPMIPMVWQCEFPVRRHDGTCQPDCLINGNYIHIGAITRVDAIQAIDGFKEYQVYEDWALYLGLKQSGATFINRPESVYLASVRHSPGHRNHSIPRHERDLVHAQIIKDVIGEL